MSFNAINLLYRIRTARRTLNTIQISEMIKNSLESLHHLDQLYQELEDIVTELESQLDSTKDMN